MIKRCAWATSGNELLLAYHDQEWGRPQTDERAMFELLSLEIMQAGLSWQTVLNKRSALKTAFANFQIDRVAGFTTQDRERLLQDAGIIRNHRKIDAILSNAQAVQHLHQEGTTLAEFLWGYVHGQPIVGHYHTADQVPATTPLATRIGEDMKKAGFSFTGPKVIYSWLEGSGVVNDHLVGCYCFAETSRLLPEFK
ncbi:DNA-3-methyladenine glycosylase I [Schleiferilactobacillus shenzhenensis]|uniref:Tag n=1 Tax=Schleiferilactobacillus shenzhenensis LY-73 TaxID=1231336 RepID=U4TQ83_9LACO|nr:Tag [Schleiferilactobacillus shenzhenensis LY-73]